ncbi:hypothetical protein QUA35_05480 [Microcoleus sp. N9_B2]|uniref:hypothetical protein n=1 Tax=unclassified Microcoleus TaxID=2642155 RepID=UPI002FD673B7
MDRQLHRVEQIVERGQLRAIAPTEVKPLLTRVSVIRPKRLLEPICSFKWGNN